MYVARTSTQAERSAVTRKALTDAARKLFTEHGYADTGTPAIVELAGVTRGALYHHFRDKQDLFRAVYEDVEKELTADTVRVFRRARDPLKAVRAGAEAWLDASLRPDARRILMEDGPSVLGWTAKREIDLAHGLGLLVSGLERAMEAKLVRRVPVVPLAHVLIAAITEAGMVVAHASDAKRARREAGAAVQSLIDGLAV